MSIGTPGGRSRVFPVMLALLAALALLAPAPQQPGADGGLLAFAQTPRGPGNLLGRNEVVGRSARGRPIALHQLGDPRWSGELLVFGCIHGDECAASAVEPLTGGCPDPSADVFLVQSTCANEQSEMTPNDALVELLTMIDAAQGASAHRIIAVLPWYGYARQDKKSAPREPISARIMAKCLEGVGTDRVLTMDLHAGQVQGFFHVPVDHMTAMPMLTQWFIDQELNDELVIVSPDAGRVKTARNFARRIGTQWAVMEKERPAQAVAEIGYVVGDVEGKTAVLVDDMIATAGTLCAAAQTVIDEGAARVIACATHGVFSGPAYERLENSAIEQIVVTDTMPLRPGAPDNITVLSTAGTFADSIRRIFTDDSVAEVFGGENQLF